MARSYEIFFLAITVNELGKTNVMRYFIHRDKDLYCRQDL